eukprot:m.202404 g.202404  ORF g.202404 m.202404 type:complete len:62 (+) comp16873_c0_seq1:4195-4380(+)
MGIVAGADGFCFPFAGAFAGVTGARGAGLADEFLKAFVAGNENEMLALLVPYRLVEVGVTV